MASVGGSESMTSGPDEADRDRERLGRLLKYVFAE